VETFLLFSFLFLQVESAAGLVTRSGAKACDPYVRLYILPDRKFKAQTRLQKKTANPTFSEVFEFK
jgi:Ca2+-dependent lipid-binding protein